MCNYCVALQDKYPGARLRECKQSSAELDKFTPLHIPKPGVTRANVYIHPRCISGPASAALAAELARRGFDMDKTVTGPPGGHGYCQLVTQIAADQYGTLILERMDGTRFEYNARSRGGKAA